MSCGVMMGPVLESSGDKAIQPAWNMRAVMNKSSSLDCLRFLNYLVTAPTSIIQKISLPAVDGISNCCLVV